jgi:zinc and cadmium transporter
VSETLTLFAYSGAVVAGALTGGALPFLGQARRSDLFLSFSAGVMLGAAFLHMLPEAIAGAGAKALPFVVVGFLFLFVLERFVLVHVCGEPGPVPEPSHEGHPESHDHHAATGCDVHTMGLTAFVGLSLHTLMDGVALGAANARPRLGPLVFVALLAHKIPSSFSLSTILRAEHYRRGRALLMNLVLALMVPAGALVFIIVRGYTSAESFTPYALAASAGTFLHISLSDLLPDLHRRGGDKLKLTVALLAGVALMWGVAAMREG